MPKVISPVLILIKKKLLMLRYWVICRKEHLTLYVLYVLQRTKITQKFLYFVIPVDSNNNNHYLSNVYQESHESSKTEHLSFQIASILQIEQK